MQLTNQQYNSMMQEYADRRQARQELINERLIALDRKLPAFRDIENELADVRHEALMASIAQDHERAEHYKNLMDSLSLKKKKILSDAGYSEDYLNPPYTCPDCKDTGYRSDGDPCHCYVSRANQLLYQQEPLMQELTRCHFQDFSLNYYPKDVRDPKTSMSSYEYAEKALTFARSFVDNFKTNHDSMVLYGNTGAGKTFLSGCIASALMEQDVSVVYLSSARMFEICSRHQFGRKWSQEPEAEYRNLFASDLLIIDDLGTELTNSFTESALFTVLNDRMNYHRSTIISTNMSLAELRDTYTSRIFSRILDNYKLFYFFGVDIRLQKGLENH